MCVTSREVGDLTTVILLAPLPLILPNKVRKSVCCSAKETAIGTFLRQDQATGDRLPSPRLAVWLVILAGAAACLCFGI